MGHALVSVSLSFLPWTRRHGTGARGPGQSTSWAWGCGPCGSSSWRRLCVGCGARRVVVRVFLVLPNSRGQLLSERARPKQGSTALPTRGPIQRCAHRAGGWPSPRLASAGCCVTFCGLLARRRAQSTGSAGRGAARRAARPRGTQMPAPGAQTAPFLPFSSANSHKTGPEGVAEPEKWLGGRVGDCYWRCARPAVFAARARMQRGGVKTRRARAPTAEQTPMVHA